MTKCNCNCCKLEKKIADVLHDQPTKDALPVLTAAHAQVLVQHAGNDPIQLCDTLEHSIAKLRDFTAKEFLNAHPTTTAEASDPLADLPDNIPGEVKALLRGLIDASPDGTEVHVIVPKGLGKKKV